MPKELGTSGNENLPAIRGLKYEETVAPELPTLAAGLVHEVKNPLAAIHLHLQLLEGYMSEVEDDGLRTKMLDKVHLLKREILGLNQILHDFIRLIRPHTGEKNDTLDLNPLVAQIIEFMEPQALREGIVIQFRAGRISGSITADPAFIKQILINLLLNSIQAFQRSGISLDRRLVRVSTGEKEGSVYLQVTDNGPGMAPEVLEKIFDPFFSTKKEGSGLGLALVKKMVSEMGGSMEVRSRPGRGTEFLVWLRDGYRTISDGTVAEESSGPSSESGEDESNTR